MPEIGPVATAENVGDHLRALYDRPAELEAELPVYQTLVPLLSRALQPLELHQPFAAGSTATIWRVRDARAEVPREYALKVPRPRDGRVSDIVRIIRAESTRLSEVNHQNVIKIYNWGEVHATIASAEYSFPYFLMDYIASVRNFDVYIEEHIASLGAEQVISYVRDILSGLVFLHGQGIIHCDIKPANLLIADGTPALISDLGYAKNFRRHASGSETEVTFTERYAHPELIEKMQAAPLDPNAAQAPMRYADLREAYDLYSFGRSLQETLSFIWDFEERSAGERGSRFTRYQWRYLALIACRLLDGVAKRSGRDVLRSDIVPGLQRRDMKDLCYRTAREALEDVERLLNLYDLEGEVPELNVNARSYIQVPGVVVPDTPRVRALLQHPALSRLIRVTQLGFVSLVYPGATHTRFEHIIGTFAYCCCLVRALWYDEENPMFRSLCDKKQIEAVLVAALLHDTGQYPMGHDVAEATSTLAHEAFTERLLRRRWEDNQPSVAELLDAEWGLNVEAVLGIAHATRKAPFRTRVLRSIINGPLDCDKLDYLQRDSRHAGVTFGLSLDVERLARNLTVLFSDASVGSNSPDVAEIGVTERALAAAQGIWRARRDMFRQVYWQHTVRALKAMLAFVVRNVMFRQQSDSALTAAFRDNFYAFVISPMAFFDSARVPSAVPVADQLEEAEVVPDAVHRVESPAMTSQLQPSDDALLDFLSAYANTTEKAMLDMIRGRDIYKRVAVISEKNSRANFLQIYNLFKMSRFEEAHNTIEERRQKWEVELIRRVQEGIDGIDNAMLRERFARVREETRVPVVLVDVPVKALQPEVQNSTEALWYEEEIPLVRNDDVNLTDEDERPTVQFPLPTRSQIRVQQESFDHEVGRVRVLVHPKWHEFVKRTLSPSAIADIVAGFE